LVDLLDLVEKEESSTASSERAIQAHHYYKWKIDTRLDAVKAIGTNFLMIACSSLEIILVHPLKSLGDKEFGTEVQGHISILRSRGFENQRMMVGLHKALGVEVDVCGGGDHLAIDSKIYQRKEIITRSVAAGLPFKIWEG
jgi:hypothetical protein